MFGKLSFIFHTFEPFPLTDCNTNQQFWTSPVHNG